MPTRAASQLRRPDGTDLLAVPPGLATVVDRQAGVLTRSQLREFGFDWATVEGAVRRSMWRELGRNVVVLHNAALTGAQRNWVAVLLPGKPAALAGLSAVTAAGLRGFEPERVHLVVAHATGIRAPSWIKVHESRRLSSDHVNWLAAPPRTRSARSVIDAAAWSRSPRRAGALLCAAVQQRVVTPGHLQAELESAGRIRHVRLMRALLGDIADGAHTLTEVDLGRLASRAGLAAPVRQRSRRDHAGRNRWLDAEFRLPDGDLLVVEVDGRGHMEVENWIADTARDNEVVIDGRIVLRFPSLTVRLDPARVVDQLRRIRLAHETTR